MNAKLLTTTILVLALTGCDEDYDAISVAEQDATEAREDLGLNAVQSIEGRVVDLLTGEAPEHPMEVEIVSVRRGQPAAPLGRAGTDEDGFYIVEDLHDASGVLYVLVDDRSDDVPAVATRVLETIRADAEDAERIIVDAYTVDASVLREIRDDLRQVEPDLRLEEEGAILGAVLNQDHHPAGDAQVSCVAGCRNTWYFDPVPSDGHFTSAPFGEGASQSGFGLVNRATDRHAGGLFLTSGPEDLTLEARHPDNMRWPRYEVPTLPDTLTIVEMVAWL